jgi:hypothetical protein
MRKNLSTKFNISPIQKILFPTNHIYFSQKKEKFSNQLIDSYIECTHNNINR